LGDADDLIQWQLVADAVIAGGYVVLVADERMRFLAASDAACELLGYARAELLQLTVPDVVVERHEAQTRYQRFLRDRKQRGEIVLRTKVGDTVAATYEASETKIGGIDYFVSVLFPRDA
jgi:PAS domain S-box-containing protein